MVASPFAFYRGSADVMARDLRSTASTGLIVQLCGDAHLSNFGAYASPERHLAFDINDFDETSRGRWEWDLKRLVASIELCGRQNGLDVGLRDEAVQAASRAYRSLLARTASLRRLHVHYLLFTEGAEIPPHWAPETRSLLDAGMPKILAKIAEEQGELAAELPAGAETDVVHETADLLFHVMVGLVARDIPFDAVWAELARRFGVSGHAEKAARPPKPDAANPPANPPDKVPDKAPDRAPE